jgi:hypothetical protein
MKQNDKNERLLSFMKKKMDDKKHVAVDNRKKSTDASRDKQVKGAKDTENEDKDKKTDEEKELDEVKKSSSAKAAGRDQTQMVKKMIVEAILKYTLLISVLAVFAIGLIKSGPAIVTLLRAIVTNLLFPPR